MQRPIQIESPFKKLLYQVLASTALCHNGFEGRARMAQMQHRRVWAVIAMIAVGLALLVLILPGHPPGSDSGFVPLISLLLFGIISPLSLLSPLAFLYIGCTPEAPELSATFQRPPPFRLA
jgi:hypothetical protein